MDLKTVRVARAVVFDSETGNILLVKRNKTSSYYPDVWEFPGGKYDDDQSSFRAVLEREVYEETGLHIQGISEDRYEIRNISSVGKHRGACFVVQSAVVSVQPGRVVLSDAEHSAWRWITPKFFFSKDRRLICTPETRKIGTFFRKKIRRHKQKASARRTSIAQAA